MTNNVGLTFSIGGIVPRFNNYCCARQLELVTLIMIFSLVDTYEPYPTIFPLDLGGFVHIHTRLLWASGLHGTSLEDCSLWPTGVRTHETESS